MSLKIALQNHRDVMVVVDDPDDYPEVLAKLQSGDDGDNSFRKRLAWKAFQHAYDSAVAEWLWKHQRDDGMLIVPLPSLLHDLRLEFHTWRKISFIFFLVYRL
jgi:phosphoribosylaminoimidazolecarboxamide formyltransferase/IMP cyclohydrolase